MGAQKDAAGQEQPGHHGPAAGDVNPFFAGVAHHERAQGKGEGHAKAHVAQVQHGRMDHHFWILQQRVKPEAIGRRGALHQGKRRRCEIQQQQEEDLDAGQDGGSVGGERHVHFVAEAQHESIGRQQPGPEQQRPFLS